jgi:hypothetical protein
MFDQGSAKRFLIDRIVAEAKKKGTPLERAEEYMLAWSESDPDFAIDDAMVNEFEQLTSEQDFERKVSTLLWHAYAADAAASPATVMTYRHACVALSKGDHYLSIMIDPRVGSPLPSRSYGESARVALAYAVTIVAAGATLIILKEPMSLRSNAFQEGVAFVLTLTFLAAFAARLLGASTIREAWLKRIGDIGGMLSVATITAVVSTIVAAVLFGVRK